MADIHVEEFYRDVAVALSMLYSAFPRRVNLFVEDIAGPDEPDEFGLHSKRHMACFGALLWLAEEGLLRYVDTIRQEALDQAVLTREAFIRLSSPAPESLARQTGAVPENEDALPPLVRQDLFTYIYLIRQALKNGNSAHINSVVRAAFFSTPSGTQQDVPEI